MKILRTVSLFCIILLSFSIQTTFAQDIDLPEPDFDKPIIQAFKNRTSVRSYDGKELSAQDLSEVLWAAYGINRPETGGRTAPSGGNSQETDIYVLLKNGTYVYNAKEHKLDLVTKESLQHIMWTQPYAESAPVHLAYVSNTDKFTRLLPADFTLIHTGLIAQNINIYCAAVGLGTVVRSPRDGGKLHGALNLGENQKITVWQAIGYRGEGGDEQAGKGGAKGKAKGKKGKKGGKKAGSAIIW